MLLYSSGSVTIDGSIYLNGSAGGRGGNGGYNTIPFNIPLKGGAGGAGGTGGTLIIDALDVPGGQCSALYPEKPIYDIPAYPETLAQDLVDNLVAQAKPFNPTYL